MAFPRSGGRPGRHRRVRVLGRGPGRLVTSRAIASPRDLVALAQPPASALPGGGRGGAAREGVNRLAGNRPTRLSTAP